MRAEGHSREKGKFMKKALILAVTVLTLTGCETAKYAVDQTVNDKSEFSISKTQSSQTASSDSALASVDGWIKRNLW